MKTGIPKLGTLDSHHYKKMGTQVPIFRGSRKFMTTVYVHDTEAASVNQQNVISITNLSQLHEIRKEMPLFQ